MNTFQFLVKRSVVNIPLLHFSRTHYSIVPVFQYSNCERSELSFPSAMSVDRCPLPVVRLSKRKNQMIPERYHSTVHNLILVRSHKSGHTEFFPLLQRGIEGDFPISWSDLKLTIYDSTRYGYNSK